MLVNGLQVWMERIMTFLQKGRMTKGKDQGKDVKVRQMGLRHQA